MPSYGSIIICRFQFGVILIERESTALPVVRQKVLTISKGSSRNESDRDVQKLFLLCGEKNLSVSYMILDGPINRGFRESYYRGIKLVVQFTIFLNFNNEKVFYKYNISLAKYCEWHILTNVWAMLVFNRRLTLWSKNFLFSMRLLTYVINIRVNRR